MSCTIYGLQEAMSIFDSHFDDVICGRKVDAEGFSMSMRRHTADPKHVGDGIVIGTKSDIEDMLGYMGRFFKLKITEPLTIDNPEKLLGGMVMGTSTGFAQRCLESHIDEFMEATGMASASPLGTPGEKAYATTEGE